MKPTLFIGSSVEGLEVANAAHQNLRSSAEVTVWDQGVFQLSKTSLESLLVVLGRTDFGMFVFSSDDVVIIRGDQNRAVRDNVLFELGLFAGRLGRERCFILIPEDAKDLRLPTDLIGMTPATLEVGRSDGSTQAATGPACHAIREAIQRLGRRRDQQQTPSAGPEPREQADSEKVAQDEPTESSAEKAKETQPSKYEWIHAYLQKDYRRAIALIEDEIKQMPEGDERTDLESWQGRMEYRLNPAIGTEVLEKLIEKYPNNAHPYIHLAFAHTGRDLFDEALRVFDRGLTAVTAKDQLFSGKARTLRDIGREEEAIRVLREAIQLDPRCAPYYHQLATIQKEIGRRDETRLTLESGLALCPDDKDLLSFYAEELFQGSDKKLALIPYNRLMSLDPTNTIYLTLRANLYLELELPDSAMRTYKKANELAQEKEVWILANIGNLYKNRGFFSDGIEYLKKAIALSPDNDYAHQRLGMSLELRQKEEEQLQTIVKEAYKTLATQRLGAK